MGTPAAYAWLPSNARLVVIDGYGTIPRGTLPVPTQPLSWPEKDPTETLDYVVDISEAVAGNEGDVIATLDATISPNNPGDLTLQSSCADGMQAILWLTAGFSGTIYTVTVTIGTNSGRVIARSITLPVQTLALQPNEPQDLLTNLDQPIDDQSGDPIETTT
jgi:hypothetical protein